MKTKTYSIPPKFYEDHRARDLPEDPAGETRVVGSKGGRLVVEMNQPAYTDLLSDADYYSDASQFERELYGLSSSARATAKALREQGPVDDPADAAIDEKQAAWKTVVEAGS